MVPKKETPFALTRKTRTGLVVLLGILVIITVIWGVLPALTPSTLDPQTLELQKAWGDFKSAHSSGLGQPSSAGATYERNSDKDHGATARPRRLFYFDPNTVSEEELSTLGLSPGTVRNLLKYRQKGGYFRKKEDLAKLYTLSKEDYTRIAPYVHIKEQQRSFYSRTYPQQEERIALHSVELNAADAAQLIRLKGIGPTYAGRIIRFRDALGGFIGVEQLKEVYGFPDSTYQQLKDLFKVNSAHLKKIDLNSATEEQLARHPYIGKRMAVSMIQLRNDFKRFTSIEQIRQTPLINEEKYRKIAPYLSIP